MKKIDLAQRLDLYRGAVIPGMRMNQPLLDFYSQSDAWMIRSKCASGVRILFNSDAVELVWTCKFGAPAREIYTTDIFVDDCMYTFTGEGPHKLELASGMKRIEIYLPHLVILEDHSLEVNDSAVVEAVAENRQKLLICGDSILQGMTCSSPARASVAIAARELDMNLHNTSVGGVTMQYKIVEDTLQIPGDMIVIGLGINDIPHKTTDDVFIEQTEKMMQLVNNFAGKSFVITPIPTGMDNLEAERDHICQMIRDVHKKYPKVVLVEGESFFPADPSLLCDGVHPNDKGMEVYAQGLIKMIRDNR